MHYTAILNPAAGHGRAGQHRAQVEAALRSAGLACSLWCSEAPGHAVALARQAAAQSDAVIAVGGDGTIQEVVRGLLASEDTAHLGVLPQGTGNDFVKMLGMPTGLKAAARALATARPRAVDYGTIQWVDHDGTHEQVFVNAVGIGFDAHAAHVANQLKHWPGLLGYLIAVLRTLWRWESPAVSITATLPSGQRGTLFEGSLLLATAGNGVSSGGMFLLTPHASITDGLLDVCIVSHASTGRVLRMVPRVLRGRHEQAREVRTVRVRRLALSAETGLPVHADGEALARAAHTLSVRVCPGGLSVLYPL